MRAIKQQLKKAANIIMKNSIITCIIACLFFLDVKLQASKISKTEPAKACLEVDGKMTRTNTSGNDIYKVELIQCNFIVSSMVLNDKNSFKFKLQNNTHYTIRVSKKGFITRLISVHVNLPKDGKEMQHFQFNTELLTLQEAKALDTDIMNFPAAILSYDDKTDRFYYNDEHVAEKKKQLYAGKLL
jgi:hypothetical protein